MKNSSHQRKYLFSHFEKFECLLLLIIYLKHSGIYTSNVCNASIALTSHSDLRRAIQLRQPSMMVLTSRFRLPLIVFRPTILAFTARLVFAMSFRSTIFCSGRFILSYGLFWVLSSLKCTLHYLYLIISQMQAGKQTPIHFSRYVVTHCLTAVSLSNECKCGEASHTSVFEFMIPWLDIGNGTTSRYSIAWN